MPLVQMAGKYRHAEYEMRLEVLTHGAMNN